MTTPEATPLTVGRRIRHFRGLARMTLDDLARATGSAPSQLSLIENGRREARVSTLQRIAAALGVSPSDLLEPEAPTRRAALEIALEEAQQGSTYARLGLPAVRAGKRLPTEALEALVGLHAELARRESEASATPEEARRANTALRRTMQARDNYLPEIEDVAQEIVRAGGHTTGALTHRTVERIAAHLGFTLVHVRDLPTSTRSVTDVEHCRIYLPPASIPGGHGLRSLALQAVAHRVLGHGKPVTYADFLRQRLEIAYFAACCLMPRDAAVAFLAEAKRNRDLAIEDFRDAFGVTHSHAAQRFTNLATSHLGLRCHFVRAARDGTLVRGYENDGVTFPTDSTGAVEGQTACRHWAARTVFEHGESAGEYHQYTDSPSGTYWCSAQSGEGTDGEFSITVGVPFDAARWFRGRETTARASSSCPDERCCRRPPADLASRWAEASWPSARMHAHILSPLPRGTFPGVDDVEVYSFLEAHAPG